MVMRVTLAVSWLVTLDAKLGCTPPGCLCDDACRFSRDGECDDSGPGSDSSTCAFGSDCHDCGERAQEDLGAFMCTNRCHSRRDGHCDDGGPGAKFKTCDFGTDCEDCGPRMAGATCTDGKVKMCGSGCMFSKDGRCDDGGPGSRYESCTLGSDCDDCGPRETPCGPEVGAASYTYEEPVFSPPPPPSKCVGGGAARCDENKCNMFTHAETTDCSHCECAACVFCVKPEGLALPPPLVVRRERPPPPPPPSPPFAFDCSMIDGRSNAKLHGGFCYSLSTAMCEGGFTYSEGAGGTAPDLALCRLAGASCEPQHVPAADVIAAGGCRERLMMPPSPPPAPSPPPHPPIQPMPQLPTPSPPAPPPPNPCIPLSAKCGGSGWGGLTECCEHPGAEVHCYTKNAYHSQCRTSCPASGWECSAGAATSAASAAAATAATAAMARPPPPAAIAHQKAKRTSPPPPTKRSSPPSPWATPPARTSQLPQANLAHAVQATQSATINAQLAAFAKLNKANGITHGATHEEKSEDESEGEEAEEDSGLLFGFPAVQVYLAGAALLVLVGNVMGCIFVCCCCSSSVFRHKGYSTAQGMDDSFDHEAHVGSSGAHRW